MSGRRSGLQKDVIDLYRRGIKAAYSKPKDARPSFLLHVRYNFRHPSLSARDVGAIEHQLRKMSRTIEMLESPSVQHMSTSSEMADWWRDHSRGQASRLEEMDTEEEVQAHEKSVTSRGDSNRSETQWGSTLPGHGGT